MIPGETPCYECFSSFRRKEFHPTPFEKYVDSDFDETKVPGQPGLWSNILTISGIAFGVIYGLLNGSAPILDSVGQRRNLILFNFHQEGFQPYATTFGRVERGCAVCVPIKALTL